MRRIFLHIQVFFGKKSNFDMENAFLKRLNKHIFAHILVFLRAYCAQGSGSKLLVVHAFNKYALRIILSVSQISNCTGTQVSASLSTASIDAFVRKHLWMLLAHQAQEGNNLKTMENMAS